MKLLASALGILTGMASPVMAQGFGSTTPPDVLSVEVDYDLGLLHIRGINMVFSGAPLVYIANQGLVVHAQYSANYIIAELPTGITVGTHELKVQKASNNSFDRFELTLGAQGPNGEQGDPGLPGVDGADGAPGRGVVGGQVSQSGILSFLYSDGTSENVGNVVGPPGASPFSLNGTVAYYLNGPIGFGTSTPTAGYQLDVVGSARITGDAAVLGTVSAGGISMAPGSTLSGQGTLHIQSNAGGVLHLNPFGNTVSIGDGGGAGDLYFGGGAIRFLSGARIGGVAPTESAGGLVVGSLSSGTKMTIYSGNNNSGGIELYSDTPAIDFHHNNSTANFTVRLFADTADRLRVDGDFQVDGNLSVSGSASKTGGGSWSLLSDRRLKQNIVPLGAPLDQLLRLRGVSFDFIDPGSIGELEGRQVGFIAQEVEEVFPEWVGEGANGFKMLTIRGFEALTVEALRELRNGSEAQITELRSEVDGLRSKLAQVEAELAGLRGARSAADRRMAVMEEMLREMGAERKGSGRPVGR